MKMRRLIRDLKKVESELRSSMGSQTGHRKDRCRHACGEFKDQQKDQCGWITGSKIEETLFRNLYAILRILAFPVSEMGSTSSFK